jgi:LPXTG-motif cell wall-anchored protein
VETAEETVIPKTDDETVLFSGLLILAGLAGMTATVVYGRRRKAVRVSSSK